MNTPVSSQAPDLIRMVSWTRLLWEKFLLAMVIATGSRLRNAMKNVDSTLTVLAHQGYQLPVRAPGDILDRWTVQLGNDFLLLDIVESNRRRRAQDETGSPTVEDLVGLDWGLDSFHHGVRQIANLDKLMKR
jgi:hypothetical protein